MFDPHKQGSHFLLHNGGFQVKLLHLCFHCSAEDDSVVVEEKPQVGGTNNSTILKGQINAESDSFTVFRR